MSKNKKENNPYKHYSIEDVAKAECGNYVLQVGDDFYARNGKVGFSRQRIEMFYDNVLSILQEMKDSKDPEERDSANKGLLSLRIYPFRIN